MDQIAIGMIAPSYTFFPVWVAQARGFFEREGIETSNVYHWATDKVTTALAQGETQIGMVTPEGVIANAAGGGPLRLIAGNANRAPLSLITAKHITRIEDLRGQRIGTSSLKEGTAIMMQAILAAHGLRYPGDYEFAVVGAHPQRWEHLKAGTIEAGLQLIPLNYVAQEAGYPSLAETIDYVPHYAFTAVALHSAWGEANRGLARRWLRALHDAAAWADANRAAAAADLAKATNTEEAFALRGINEMFDIGATPRNLRIEPEALEAVFAAMKAAELVAADTELTYAKAVDDSYLDAAS